jgi:hypothetical protein
VRAFLNQPPLDWDNVIDPVPRLGFTYVLSADEAGYYYRVSKSGVELSDIRLPCSSAAQSALAIAAILAAQRVRG